jgi:hypothetical protein
MRVPPRLKICNRVAAVLDECLPGDVGGEDVFGNGVEQRILVLEEPIDGRRLRAGRLRDRTGRDRACALLTQELRRALHNVRGAAERVRRQHHPAPARPQRWTTTPDQRRIRVVRNGSGTIIGTLWRTRHRRRCAAGAVVTVSTDRVDADARPTPRLANP